jgi:bifunctional NMN adenylyltransferase/nudix hydrolase
MNKKYNFAVYIGRFEPFHLGHLHIVENALKLADKLIIVVGSNNSPINWKNPWTSAERIEMIRSSLTPEQLERIHFQTVEDRLYQDKEWQAFVYEAVDSVLMQYSKLRVKGRDDNHTAKICLVGFDKDSTSWYLKAFPEWTLEAFPMFNIDENDEALSATMIRDMLYHNRFGYIKSLVSAGTFAFIKHWLATEAAAYVKEWYDQEVEYQEPYEVLPHGTNFYCADNVVFQSGHVLLIRRKDHPGKGLWALPGGHVNLNEKAEDASIRELKEETKIKVPEKVLRGSLVGEKVFDHPERSLRGRCGKKVGRTISYAFCYNLQDGNLPRVTASDDAAEAWWFNLAEIRKMKAEIFEDHYSIIEYFMSRV